MVIPIVLAMPILALVGPAFAADNSQIQSAPYYVCSEGKNAFVASFGPDQKMVTIDTSAHGHYALKRTPVSSGKMFSAGGVTFWTDGTDVRLTGMPKPYTGCHKS